MKPSELFDSWVYLEDLCYALCATLFELPNVAVLTDVWTNVPYLIELF